jgi:hypothetical protein
MINFKFSNERRVSAMMNTYKDQITNLCIQTYYNLYGVMPDAQELAEMIGEAVAPLDEKQAA